MQMHEPQARPWGRIEIPHSVKTESGEEPTCADVYIYGEIGAWGDVGAKEFADRISALDVDRLNVYINSVGGAAWDGLAIMNALRRHKATVYATVDALAASAASVITMGADHITMNRGSEMMVHDASGLCVGNAADMREIADVLDKLCDSYADAYAARAGGDREHWRGVMRAETWYTAEEAVLAGLADEWVDAPAAAASATAFDLSGFRYQGRAHAPAPTTLPASEPGEPPTRKETAGMNDNTPGLVEEIRQRLGLTDAADDSAILAAFDERLTAPTQAASTIPEGTALVDKTLLDQLRADAAAGREAATALAASRREDMISSAIKAGRIAPSSRAAWMALAERDEDAARDLLAAMPENTIPVAEIGVTSCDETQTETDRLYAAAWGGSEKKEA
mgnify:FL=1